MKVYGGEGHRKVFGFLLDLSEVVNLGKASHEDIPAALWKG